MTDPAAPKKRCVQCGRHMKLYVNGRCSTCREAYSVNGDASPPLRTLKRAQSDSCAAVGCVRARYIKRNKNGSIQIGSTFCRKHMAHPDLRGWTPQGGVDRFRSSAPVTR